MTSKQKFDLKLKIVQAFKGLHFTLVEMFEILDELKNEASEIVIKRELEKLKFKEK